MAKTKEQRKKLIAEGKCVKCETLLDRNGTKCVKCLDQYKAWKQKRIDNNLCISCGNPKTDATKTCKACNKKHVIHNKQYRHELVANGLCVDCAKIIEGKTKMCKDCLDKRNTYSRNKIKDRKKIVFDHYGNICKCCGLNDIRFLTVDHINNDGGGKYRDSNFYSWIIKNNFPDNLQLLCWNCNCAKSKNNGICPHKMEI